MSCSVLIQKLRLRTSIQPLGVYPFSYRLIQGEQPIITTLLWVVGQLGRSDVRVVGGLSNPSGLLDRLRFVREVSESLLLPFFPLQVGGLYKAERSVQIQLGINCGLVSMTCFTRLSVQTIMIPPILCRITGIYPTSIHLSTIGAIRMFVSTGTPAYRKIPGVPDRQHRVKQVGHTTPAFTTMDMDSWLTVSNAWDSHSHLRDISVV